MAENVKNDLENSWFESEAVEGRIHNSCRSDIIRTPSIVANMQKLASFTKTAHIISGVTSVSDLRHSQFILKQAAEQLLSRLNCLPLTKQML